MNRTRKTIRIGITLVLVLTSAIALAQDAPTVWTGETITFRKAAGTDPTVAANQDRITDSVWITRRNEGGQIFNIVVNNRANSRNSPEGTRWAFGTTAELDTLDFGRFRQTVEKPQDVVGKPLVLHVVEEDIYIDLIFTEWLNGKRGGFAYERSTP